MLTRFISDRSFDAFNVEYPYDDNLEIKNIQLNVDGNLNYNIIPSFKETKDIKTNNYVLTILSRNDNLGTFLNFKDEINDRNSLSYVYSNSSVNIDENALFWRVDNQNFVLDNSFDKLDRTNIFKIDFLDDSKCKIYHEKNNQQSVLSYSLLLSSLKFVSLTAENIDIYPKEFDYILDSEKIIFYVKNDIGNFAIKKQNTSLIINYVSEFNQDNSFYLKRKDEIDILENINNWVSYQNTFNKNNLNVSEDRSHFDIKNNHLFTTTINSIFSALPVNVMTLKNQLNQENDQSRGNVFLGENETNLKEYESIFTGGWRELGYDKINLGYTSYTTPFVFKSGKTTYFHVPHEIYPYEKLNVNSSKLAESGAVGGNCPLNSDKIWKKLKNYRETSPYSLPHEENTGQWLCTWLSAGNPDTRPVWMDRYYNPSKTTPYVALSAIATEIVYKDSFNCLDLDSEISDVKSSLTFEKGVYYAYMHLGKNDYENLIKESISSKILYDNLQTYQRTNFFDLESFENEYLFEGKEYGYIESSKKFENNNATFSFFLEKEDWNKPSGNLIFGNYINNGFGFYNYVLNTPYFLLKENENTLVVLNNKLQYIDDLSTENLTLCSIKGISRRNGFENIHVFTEDFKLIEFDLRGTIVDSNSAIKSVLNLSSNDEIYSVTNDEYHSYVWTSNGIARVDLSSNIVDITSEKTSIGSDVERNLLVDDQKNIYKIYGKQPIKRGTDIYFLSSNNIKSYSTTLSSISNLLQTPNSIDCFNVSKEGDLDVVTDDNYLVYNNNELKYAFTLSLSSNSLSAKQFSYSEKFEYGEIKKYKNIFCQNEEGSYVIRFDENYNRETIKLDKKYDIVQNNLDISNYNHNVQCLSAKYGEETYHFKVKLLNKVNLEDYNEINFIINSNDLSTGYCHFVFSIDCYNGIANFYLDGQLYESINFIPKKYILSNTFNERIFYGCNGYFNGVPSFKYFKDVSDFTIKGFKLKENYIINKALEREEAVYFYSKIYPPNDLKYNMPSSTRSFIDSMEKVFNFNIPMFKSTRFKLNILNSGIAYENLRKELEEHISERLKDYLPFYTKLEGFEWIDTVARPVVLEGDYNVSNTLTNIL
jgi:hypothetical protein